MSKPGKKKKPAACLCLVLHAHLPYVRHPEYKNYLEEDWLYEAITETYLRLIDTLAGMRRQGVPFRFALSLTPTLMNMLGDPLLLGRYEERLEKLRRLAALECRRLADQPAFCAVARFNRNLLDRMAALFVDDCNRDLVSSLAAEARQGGVELLGSSATHAILPLLRLGAGRRAQIRSAMRDYRDRIGYAPEGFWLPECAFVPGLELDLAQEGISHFFVEGAALEQARPRPGRGVWQPARTRSGTAAFARHEDLSRLIWGGREGYPGHPFYREFYRDLAFDADKKYLAPFLHSDKVRRPLGIKYHRITGLVPLYEKEPWNPAAARAQVKEHARQFVDTILDRARQEGGEGKEPPLATVAFDAELFGHWWFEGPWFLEELFREMARRDWELQPVTPAEWLQEHGAGPEVEPETTSWGRGASFSTWLNPDTAWIWRHLHAAERLLADTLREQRQTGGLHRRVLDQALRELLLAQASDWPFIMTKRTQVSYAVKRFREHIHCLRLLLDQARADEVDLERLEELERRHPFCRTANYRDFS